MSTTLAAPSLLSQATAHATESSSEVVRKIRSAGLDHFASVGLPTTKIEDWHYTSVARIADAQFSLLGSAVGSVAKPDITKSVFSEEWPRIVFVDGRYSEELSSTNLLPAGISVCSLEEAIEKNSAGVSDILGSFASPERDGFTALNSAFLGTGTVILISKEMLIDTPIHIFHVSTDQSVGGMYHPRLLVIAEEYAKATIVETWLGLTEGQYFNNAVSEISLATGANIQHLKIQQEGNAAFHVATTEVRQGKDSHFQSFTFTTGSLLSRTNIYTVLDGEGCGTTLNGLTMLGGRQHGDLQTRIEHAKPNCFSRQLCKSVLDENSHGVFNGQVYVRPIAQQTDGKQTNNTLLLSPSAQIDAKPQLEIFADDVRCTHGATVGQLDQTALFYMKSRGIPSAEAKQLLTYAFAADALETIETELVRNALEEMTLYRFTSEPT